MADDQVARCRASVEQLAVAALSTARTADDLARLLRAVDEVVIAAVARGGARPKIACRGGCASCCTVNVATLPVEGAVAAAFLRRALSPAELARLAARLRTFHGAVRWLEDHERVRGAFRCPLLDAERRCVIHPVRPLACRGVTSIDAADCRRAMASPDEDDPPVVRMHVLQKTLYEEALDALRDVLGRSRLDARRRDVSGMTAVFLESPDLLGEYLGGAEVPVA